MPLLEKHFVVVAGKHEINKTRWHANLDVSSTQT